MPSFDFFNFQRRPYSMKTPLLLGFPWSSPSKKDLTTQMWFFHQVDWVFPFCLSYRSCPSAPSFYEDQCARQPIITVWTTRALINCSGLGLCSPLRERQEWTNKGMANKKQSKETIDYRQRRKKKLRHKTKYQWPKTKYRETNSYFKWAWKAKHPVKLCQTFWLYCYFYV